MFTTRKRGEKEEPIRVTRDHVHHAVDMFISLIDHGDRVAEWYKYIESLPMNHRKVMAGAFGEMYSDFRRSILKCPHEDVKDDGYAETCQVCGSVRRRKTPDPNAMGWDQNHFDEWRLR